MFAPKVDGSIEEHFGKDEILLKDDWRVEMEDRLPSSSSPMAQETKKFRVPPCFPRVPGADDCRLMERACCLCTITILLDQGQIKLNQIFCLRIFAVFAERLMFNFLFRKVRNRDEKSFPEN